MIDSGESKYIIPSGDGKGEPIVIDMLAVVRAEIRLREVATVNVHTAAELLSCYNEHWLTCHQAVTKLTYERNRADEAVKIAYAEALLDCNDEAIKKRGHSKASQDLREAMASTTHTVRAAKERLNEIKVVLDYLSGKRQAFENAYNSVKKLVATPQLPTEAPRFGAKDPFGDRRAAPPLKLEDDIVFEEETQNYPQEVLEGFYEPNGRR